jgi:hypothetical protein
MPTKIRRRIKVVPPPKKKLFDAKSIVFIIVFLAALISYILYSGSGKKEPHVAPVAETNRGAEGKTGPTGTQTQTFESKADVPSVTKAKFEVESVDNKDSLKVIAEGNTIGNTPVSFRYAWTKNGQPVEGGGDSISGFKRGDKVDVKITPYIGELLGQPRTLSTEIKNSTPKVTENKKINFDGTLLTYQVKATDPDGDTLTYALMDAPQGMTIDGSNGLISFPVKDDTPASISFKVKISDGNGGEIIYPLTVSLEKPPPEKAKPVSPKK